MTAKEVLELYQKTALDCLDKWLVGGYAIRFEMALSKQLAGKYASVTYNTIERWAFFRILKGRAWTPYEVIYTAYHEAAHLVLALLADLARSRFVLGREIDEQCEAFANRFAQFHMGLLAKPKSKTKNARKRK